MIQILEIMVFHRYIIFYLEQALRVTHRNNPDSSYLMWRTKIAVPGVVAYSNTGLLCLYAWSLYEINFNRSTPKTVNAFILSKVVFSK